MKAVSLKFLSVLCGCLCVALLVNCSTELRSEKSFALNQAGSSISVSQSNLQTESIKITPNDESNSLSVTTQTSVLVESEEPAEQQQNNERLSNVRNFAHLADKGPSVVPILKVFDAMELALKSSEKLDLTGILFDENDAEEWISRIGQSYDTEVDPARIQGGQNELLEISKTSAKEFENLRNYVLGDLLKVTESFADKSKATKATEMVVEMVDENSDDVRTYRMLFCHMEKSYKLLLISPIQ
ncbi:MAG: hypothetical protein GY751_02675 [Bacteroidetes bacterium]|nr:hypothetical protein [Bacteroidota bacterium]